MGDVQTKNAVENGRVDGSSEDENCSCQRIQFTEYDAGIYVTWKISPPAAENTL